MPQSLARRRVVRPPRSAAPAEGATRCAVSLPLQRAQLPPVPSTLLIPLAARAHGGRYFPWLDCHDAVAPALLAQMDAELPERQRRSAGMLVALRPWVFSLLDSLRAEGAALQRR